MTKITISKYILFAELLGSLCIAVSHPLVCTVYIVVGNKLASIQNIHVGHV
jgi:hypothetical protein